MAKRKLFLADPRTLRWCARQVRDHCRNVESGHWSTLHRVADALLERAPRLVERKPKKAKVK